MEESNDLIEINAESNSVIKQADNISITNQTDLEYAAIFLNTIKDTQKKITEYWKEPKKVAHDAHKKICDKEAEMLNPLKESEKIIKAKITAYNYEMQQKALEEEKRIKAEQEKLALEQLKEAERLRQEGNELEANIVENNAITISEMETKIDTKIEKVAGLSFRKDYIINIIDPAKVPSYTNGIEIRKIDESAIKKLVKLTNNTVKIDGIEVKEIQVPISK